METAGVGEPAMELITINKGEQMRTEHDEISAILNKHDITDLDDIGYGDPVYDDLFTYYMDSGEMPYGVMKARTGDPCEWIVMRVEELGIVTETV
jgi:hypothetical protein